MACSKCSINVKKFFSTDIVEMQIAKENSLGSKGLKSVEQS